MAVSPHVEYVGDDISASTTASTAYCAGPGGSPLQSWTWSAPPGPVVSGCTADAPTCVVLATAATSAWATECINGSAWVGGWQSCDYYGVVGGAPTISVAVSPGSIPPDGQSTTTATAVVSDGGTPESGDAVSFSSSDPGQSIGAVTDNGDGTYTATITASKTAGNATITATDATPGTAVSATTTLTSAGGERNAGVTVSCLPKTPASLVDTCTVAVADISGQTPPQTPTGTVTVTAGAGQVTGGGSCGSVTPSTGGFTCTVGYIPPSGVGGMTSAPVVTATYAGDSNFAPAVGTESITCTSGAVFQLDSLTSTAPTANGFEIDEPATLHGCGLTAKTQARFGSDDAEVTPTAANAASDGKSITVDIPEYAITGPLSVTDTSQPIPRTVTLATPNPVTIDSWRNTNGFSFKNLSSAVTEADVIAAFPGSDLAVPGSRTTLRPWAYQWYLMHTSAGGVCFGLGQLSGEFATGALSPSALQPTASTGFDLTSNVSLTHHLVQAWLGQWSDEYTPYRKIGATTRTESAVEGQLRRVMDGQNGFDRPALVTVFFQVADNDSGKVKWEGHTEVAYGWEPHEGGLIIHTADSNLPFASTEYSDTTDKNHEAALADSWIEVSPGGNVWFPYERFGGHLAPTSGQLRAEILINPISALTGPLNLSRSAYTGPQAASLSLSPSDTVGAVREPTGKAVGLAARKSPVQVQPFITSGAPAGTGSGISELWITEPHTTVTLSAGSRPIRALWQSAGTDVALTTSPGRLLTGFAPASGALTLSPVAGDPAPRTATVQVTEKLARDTAERILTVTGPADLTAGLAAGSAHVTAPDGGRLTLSLSALGSGHGIQTTTLGTITAARGQTLTLTPGSWHKLATTTVRGRLSGGRHRRHRRLRLHNHKAHRRPR